MPLNSLVEVLIKVELVDKCLLLANDWHKDVLDTNLELGCIDVAEVLLVSLESQVFLLSCRIIIHGK